MKNIGLLLLRALVIAIGVAVITAGLYAVNGGQSVHGLSDWLVYASFITLAIGTLVGVTHSGYRRASVVNEEPPEGCFEKLVKDFFLAGPFGISFALAGPLCFGAAVLVDLMFTAKV